MSIIFKPTFINSVNKITGIIYPKSEVIKIERLHGGIDNQVFLINLLNAQKASEKIILKLRRKELSDIEPNAYGKQYKLLSMLYEAGLPVQLPLWYDTIGELFGTQAIALSYLDGNPTLSPINKVTWVKQLGEALAKIHCFDISKYDMSFLTSRDKETECLLSNAPEKKIIEEHPNGKVMWDILNKNWFEIKKEPRTLIHQDYHPGNIIFNKNTLSGVIDWDGASIGHPTYDVSHNRVDLAMQFGQDVADLFLEAYEKAIGYKLKEIFFWDIHRAWAALPNYKYWIPAMHGIGRLDLNEQNMGERLNIFIHNAINQ